MLRNKERDMEASMKSVTPGRTGSGLLVLALVSGFVGVAGRHGVEDGVNVWTSTGPAGGGLTVLVVDEMSPTTIYAGSGGNGIFKSIDGGATLRRVSAGIGNQDFWTRVLVIDPMTPSNVYTGSSSGFFKSTDGGETWSVLSAPGWA